MARLNWFHQAKYGLFINWGLYSIPAGQWKGKPIGGIGEWIMHNARIPVKEYEQLAKQFNPVKFNADEWAQLAADAGMKYVVFDCKHHDGFALYHSAVSKYNCYDATPWKRDPFKELQAACGKRGLKLCFYYSQATDWHEPNGANNDWDFRPNNQKDFDQYFRDKSHAAGQGIADQLRPHRPDLVRRADADDARPQQTPGGPRPLAPARHAHQQPPRSRRLSGLSVARRQRDPGSGDPGAGRPPPRSTTPGASRKTTTAGRRPKTSASSSWTSSARAAITS